MSEAVDPFYELYANKGLIPAEIFTNGIIALICLLGIFLNFCLVYVTIKTKSLHSPCRILIALFAFFSSFLLFGNSVKFFVFLFAINYISLRLCFFIQIVPIICSSFALNLQLGIGIDRLCGVLFPIWHKSRGKYIFFKLIIAFCCIRSPLLGLTTYIGCANHWEKPVMCQLGDPTHQPEYRNYVDITAFILYCGEFLSYALLWLIIWKRSAQMSEHVKKLTISVSVLMSIGLICYILNLILAKGLMPLLNLGPFAIEYFVTPISSIFQTMAYGSCAPVLYLCNAQYRSAFRSLFAAHNQIASVSVTAVAQFDNNNNNRQNQILNRAY